MSSQSTGNSTPVSNASQLNIEIQIRPMKIQDVDGAIQCFADHYDLFDCSATVEAFFHICPQAFYVAVLDNPNSQTQEVIGVCGAPFGPHDSAFIGLYGIHCLYRNRGIGSKLFQKCIEFVGSKNVGLYAVPEMKEKYIKRGGFKVREEVSMVNFLGFPTGYKKLSTTFSAQIISEMDKKVITQLIVDYDQNVHHEARPKLLKFVLDDPRYITAVVYASDQKSILGIYSRLDLFSKHSFYLLLGYGCIRQHSHSGRLMLGPLYANNVDVAESISLALITSKQQQSMEKGLIWNALDCCAAALSIASKIGLQEVERCERIFTQNPITANYSIIYSVFSPDFSI